MRRVLVLLLVLGVGVFLSRLFDCLTSTAEAQQCANENGDVNGDSTRDIADTIYLLAWLFNQGPEPEPFCPTCDHIATAVWWILFRDGMSRSETR